MARFDAPLFGSLQSPTGNFWPWLVDFVNFALLQGDDAEPEAPDDTRGHNADEDQMQTFSLESLFIVNGSRSG